MIFSLLQCQKAAVRGARQLAHMAPGAGALLWEKEYAKGILWSPAALTAGINLSLPHGQRMCAFTSPSFLKLW